MSHLDLEHLNDRSPDGSENIFSDDSSGSNNNNVPIRFKSREAVTLYHDYTSLSAIDIDNCLKRKLHQIDDVVMIDDDDRFATGEVVIDDDNDSNKRINIIT